MADKLKEGRSNYDEAEKAINRTSFFGLVKSKPDFDTALHFYEQAAASFRNAKAWDEAVKSFNGASRCYKELGSLAMSGKALENAGNICTMHLKKSQEAVDFYLQGSNFYRAAGNLDKSVELVEKASKVWELDGNSVKALEVQLTACELYEHVDKPRMAVETFRRSFNAALKFKRTDVALTLIPQLKALYITTTNVPNLYKLYLSQVILLLSIKDEISAKKELELCMGNVDFTGSEECEVASGYIEAFEKGDSELLVKLSKRGVITRLENEVIKIAMSINVPGGHRSQSSSNPNFAKEAPSPTRGRPTSTLDDEDLGIC